MSLPPLSSGRNEARQRAGACVWHPQERAVLSCARCAAPICAECVEIVDGRELCIECARSHRRSRWMAAGVAFGVFVFIVLAGALALWYQSARRAQRADDAAMMARQLEVDPDNDVLRMQYVGVLTREGKFDDAILQLTRVIERNPRNVFLYERMFRMCMRARRYDDALLWVERQLKNDPNSARWMMYQGEAYLAQGRRQEAEGSWLQAYAMAPSDGELAMKLADLYMEDQRLADARAILSATLERMPNGRLRDLVVARLGEIHRRMGRQEEPDEP